MEVESQSAGDPVPPACTRIEVRVADLKNLFNTMDPSPFRQRDLDPEAEQFIVDWAREAPRRSPLALLIHLDRRAGQAKDASDAGDAIREFFRLRSAASERRIHQLFHNGRISLVIGVTFLAGLVVLGDQIAESMRGRRLGEVLRESLLVGGWVAMWRPLEIFLYEWWPIRAEERLYKRLSKMPVKLTYTASSGS